MKLFKTSLKAMFNRGTLFRRYAYLVRNLREMIEKGSIHKDKLLWKILSDGAQKLDREFDLAVAYLEGGSTYYVDSYVKAKRKVAFIHTDYCHAGYSRILDENCYLNFDQIFTISENAKKSFLSVYPECKEYTKVFNDLINRKRIIDSSKEEGGFLDDYKGYRILTVGRLVPTKAIDVAINAMKVLKNSSKPFRWYVLGEGEMRKKLEEQIRRLKLEKDFVLLGTVENPFPYYAQCSVYVHTTYFEGKGSIALEEAQILGCAIIATEHDSVWEQVEDGVDGKICKLDSEAIAESILDFVNHPQKMKVYGEAAFKKDHTDSKEEMRKLLDLIL